MKTLTLFLLVSAVVIGADAVTFHRSFRKGYPVGVTTRQQPNAAVLTAPKSKVCQKSVVVTNRVIITKEQAAKLLKNKKKYKKVEAAAGSK